MRRIVGALSGLCLLGLVIGNGCATYANYPSIGNDAAVNDPNVAPLPELMTLALIWVVDSQPVEDGFVVNLPEGMDRARAERIVGRVGRGATLVSEESIGLPVYHVTRVWLRGDGAEVDVLRPVSGASGASGASQLVTVRLGSRLGSWEVRSTKVWPVGMVEAPPLYGWDGED